MGFATLLSACSFAFLLVASLSLAIEVTYDGRAIKIDGERKIILSGSIHYPRSTPGMWQSLIRKAKEGGLNAIETYVFWNAHEPQRREYDFSGNLDLVRFIKTIQEEGLYAILRIGPYVCAEWNYGGFPVWLHSLPNIEFRTNNDVYKNEMASFTTLIVSKMKHEKLFASQGGPIILSQIENEYGNVEWAYGMPGWNYVTWCANLASSYDVGVPWIMCQQDNAPSPMISTCNGFYCDNWYPKRNDTPKIWTENWTGWFKKWGSQDPHRTAEDVAYAVARFFQRSGTVQNYYMYHGGTNFGRTAGGPYITTSYDYDAPLDEYGNLNQPKWGHLKQLHYILRSMEKVLTYGERSSIDFQNDRYATIYAYQGKRSCFLANPDKNSDFTFNFEGNQYNVPAWSVSILPDCYTEEYNTAKVNAQTSIMIKKPNAADDFEEPYRLNWTWRHENPVHLNKKGTLKGSVLTANVLLDQKRMTNGSSDYLWLMTSFQHNHSDHLWGKKKDIRLHVHSYGHIIHAYINGKRIGLQWAENGHFEFDFEKKIRLRHGTNRLTLLSVTVGLTNYGPHFDTTKVGIRGPVKLILRNKKGDQEVTRDLSKNQWVYKTGLPGQEMGCHVRWNVRDRPSNKPFVWYKTTFPSPMGQDPVVVDLRGLGKGTAWVNGHDIGRYWPSYLAPEDGCSVKCDYRGSYGSNKCSTNCGKSSQRWYHIPRDFLRDDDNVLLLFEEFGGSPDLVNIETVTVGKVCADAYEGNTLELSCQGGKVFSEIKFASFGLPGGTCGDFHKTECHAQPSLDKVQEACLGNQKCSLQVSEETFGFLRCKADQYRLAVEAVC